MRKLVGLTVAVVIFCLICIVKLGYDLFGTDEVAWFTVFIDVGLMIGPVISLVVRYKQEKINRN